MSPRQDKIVLVMTAEDWTDPMRYTHPKSVRVAWLRL